MNGVVGEDKLTPRNLLWQHVSTVPPVREAGTSNTAVLQKGRRTKTSYTDACTLNSDLTRRRGHTCTHICTQHLSEKNSQYDPCLCEPERRGQLSHRCRVGAEALLPPYLSRLPEHHQPTPLCLKFDHLEVHTANMSPLLKGQHSWDS